MARIDDIVMYADYFLEYRAALHNIAEHGSIVIHPRTGAPVDNPYIKVKAVAAAGLQKLRRIKKIEGLWQKEIV